MFKILHQKKIRKIRLILKNDFENQNSEIFDNVLNNFGRSDDDMIWWKNDDLHRCIHGFMPNLHKKYWMVSILHTCLLAWCNIYLPTYTIVYYYTCLRSFNKTAAPRRCVAQWFQIAQNSPKISSPNVISRVFPCKFLQIHITSVYVCLDFTFKICQIVAGTSMIRHSSMVH